MTLPQVLWCEVYGTVGTCFHTSLWLDTLCFNVSTACFNSSTLPGCGAGWGLFSTTVWVQSNLQWLRSKLYLFLSLFFFFSPQINGWVCKKVHPSFSAASFHDKIHPPSSGYQTLFSLTLCADADVCFFLYDAHLVKRNWIWQVILEWFKWQK